MSRYVISLIVNAFIGDHGFVKIGAIHFALLGGRVIVKDVLYCSKNISIRLVRGIVMEKGAARNQSLGR